jgi:hypothetical protein
MHIQAARTQAGQRVRIPNPESTVAKVVIMHLTEDPKIDMYNSEMIDLTGWVESPNWGYQTLPLEPKRLVEVLR